MSAQGGGKANELTLQNEMLKHLVSTGLLLGKAKRYNRELALYPEDLLGFVQVSQTAQWKKLFDFYPSLPEQNFLARVASQLNKTAPNLGSALRAFCTAPLLGRCEPAKALAA